MKKLGLLHSCRGLRANPDEQHTLVDEKDRLEALEIIRQLTEAGKRALDFLDGTARMYDDRPGGVQPVSLYPIRMLLKNALEKAGVAQ